MKVGIVGDVMVLGEVVVVVITEPAATRAGGRQGSKVTVHNVHNGALTNIQQMYNAIKHLLDNFSLVNVNKHNLSFSTKLPKFH